MKILIVSDTHGWNENLFKTIERVSPFDLLIHLGDFGSNVEYIRSIATCPLEIIPGNNDLFSGLPKEKLIKIGNYSVLLTHGHRYGVYNNTHLIKEAARSNKADIVMFGHTHQPVIDLSDSIWVINPGSISLPRQGGRIPTFIIMDIDNNGKAHFTLNYYKE